MAAITSQGKLEEGLQPINSELKSTSKGQVSDKGLHIPDVDMIDGKNIMPTLFGYTSFFGLHSTVGIDTIPDKVQDIIAYRTFRGNTLLVAFCRNSIYIKSQAGDADPVSIIETATEITIQLEDSTKLKWTKVLDTEPSSPWEMWTWCNIRNKLYMYQKGLGRILRLDGNVFGTIVFSKLSPTYIIGDGQKDIWTLHSEDILGYQFGYEYGDDTYKSFNFDVEGENWGDYFVDLSTLPKLVTSTKQWENVITNSGIFACEVIENSREETDFNMKIAFNGLVVTPSECQLYNPAYTNTGKNYRGEVSIDGPESHIEVVNTVVAVQEGDFPYAVFDIRFSDILLSDANITMSIEGETVNFSWNTSNSILERIQILVNALDSFTNSTLLYVLQYDNGTVVRIHMPFDNGGAYLFPVITIDDSISGTHSDYTSLAVLTNSNTSVFKLDGLVEENYWVNPENCFRNYNLQVGIQSGNSPVIPSGTDVSITFGKYTITHIADGIKELEEIYYDIAIDFTIQYPDDYTLLDVSAALAIVRYENDNNDPMNFAMSDINYTGGIVYHIEAHRSRYIHGTFGGTYAPFLYDFIEYYAMDITGFDKGDSTYITIGLFDDDTGELLYKEYIPLAGFKYTPLAIIDKLTPVLNLDETNIYEYGYCKVNYDIKLTISHLTFPVTSTITQDQDGHSLWNQDPVNSSIDQLPQVEGIYSARDRLGTWNVDNRINWSSATDPVDFLPSQTTQANELSVNAIRGNIVFCLGHDNGFIIYSTGNVVFAEYVSGQFVFNFRGLENSPGCIDPRHIAGNLSSHYYWSNLGMYLVIPKQAEVKVIDKSLVDWLNKYRFPIYIKLINSRFIIIDLQYELSTFSYRRQRELTAPNLVDKGYIANPFDPVSNVDLPVVLFGKNLYPKFKRALIFDILLSKWGTCDIPHNVIYSLNPINQQGFPVEKNYFNFDATLHNELRGIGILDTNNLNWLADSHPDDSYCLFGKYATHRYKETKLVELFTEFVNVPVNTVAQIERNIDTHIIYDITEDDRINGIVNRQDLNLAGNWFNILIRGEQYHLKRLMTRGYNYGR